jgi:hypothetical protein
MIKESTTLIPIVSRTVQKYRDLGYVCQVGKELEINVNDLSLNSHHLITAVCDVCGLERKLSYYAYMKNWNKYGYYNCNYCKQGKIEKTNQKKYGVRRPIQNKEIHQKLEATNIAKYGYACAVKSEQVKKREPESKLRIENKLLYKYRELDILGIEGSKYKIKCKKKHEYQISDIELYRRIKYGLEICLECNPKERNIKEIGEIFDYIRNIYQGEIEISGNTLKTAELGIIIEVVDLLEGSEVYQERTYWRDKKEKLKREGYELYLVYVYNWKNRKSVLKGKLNRLFGIKDKLVYSDELNVSEVEKTIGKEFIEKNSLREYELGSIIYGLYSGLDLYSIIILKRDGFKYELLDYIEKKGYRVVGGGKKLLKGLDYILYGYSIDILEEEVYQLLGFRRAKRMPIRYRYIKGEKQLSRRYVMRLDLGFGKIAGKDDHEICLDNGIFRIYDVGRVRWEYNK